MIFSGSSPRASARLAKAQSFLRLTRFETDKVVLAEVNLGSVLDEEDAFIRRGRTPARSLPCARAVRPSRGQSARRRAPCHRARPRLDRYGHKSYANIASVLWAEAGQEDTYEFVRRVVFSVLIGNADMHLKNWSLLYPDRRTPALSPAYDFVATLPYLPKDLALNFGGSRSLDEITRDQMRRFADTARIPASPLWEITRETAERTTASWKTLEQADVLPNDLRGAIGKQIQRVAASVTK